MTNVALLTALLVGMAGSSAEAVVLVHAPTDRTIVVDGVSVPLRGGVTERVSVPVVLAPGHSNVTITIIDDALVYELTVETVGRRDYRWVWAVGAVPFALLIAGVRLRFRKTNGGNS